MIVLCVSSFVNLPQNETMFSTVILHHTIADGSNPFFLLFLFIVVNIVLLQSILRCVAPVRCILVYVFPNK